MHLLKDENGNPIPHGGQDYGHEQGHCHGHGHDHEQGHCHDHEHGHEHCHGQEEGCGHSCGGEGDCKNETLALLTYMLQHNEHHAAELDQMADNLAKLGMEDAAKQIKDGVADFQKGNMRLSLALTLVKEHLKEA